MGLSHEVYPHCIASCNLLSYKLKNRTISQSIGSKLKNKTISQNIGNIFRIPYEISIYSLVINFLKIACFQEIAVSLIEFLWKLYLSMLKLFWKISPAAS